MVFYFFILFNRYGWFENYPILKGIQNLFPLVFSPLLFILFAHYLVQNFKISLKQWYYFSLLIPFILGLIPFLFYLKNPQNNFILGYTDRYIFIENEFGALGFLVISIWTLYKLNSIKQKSENNSPSTIKYLGNQYIFLRTMSILILFHGIIWILDINLALFHPKMAYYANQVNLIYFLIVGYIFVFLFLNYPVVIYETGLEKELPEKEKYQYSTLADNKAKEYLHIMNQYMIEKKPFLDADLTLLQLSEQLNLSHTLISEIMNNIVSQNFYDYVNNFRVEEFKRLVKDKNNRHLKILSLAYDSGFKSKTTFNTAFKKFTGITPSEYMKQNG